MSDEENEGNGLPFHVMHLGPTPEQIEQARMEASVNGHENLEFLLTLDSTQLRRLQGILHTCVQSDGLAAQYFIGLVSGILTLQHKICLVCGVDHDQALQDMGASPEKSEYPTGGQKFPAKGTKMYHRYMADYGMERDDNGSDRVMCTNCSMWYESLEDRMLRKSDKTGCTGCMEKEKWG